MSRLIHHFAIFCGCAVILGCSITAFAADQFAPLPEDSGTVEFSSPGSGSYTFGPDASNSGGSSAPAQNQDNAANDTGEAGDAVHTQEEFAALHLIELNKLRVDNGLPELQTDTVLTQIAMQRAAEYQSGHKRADGSKWTTIFAEYDTDLRPTGENMTMATKTVEQSMENLLSSEGHTAIMLSEKAEYVGIGAAWRDTEYGYRIVLVQVFAK